MPSDQNVLRPKRPYVFERNFSLKLKYHLIQGRVVDLKVPIKTGWHVRHTLPRVDISVYLIRYLIKCDSQLRRLIVNYLLLLKLFIAKSEKCFLTPRRHSNRTHKSAIYWTPMRHSNHWATRTQMATRFVRATYVLLNQWISCYRSNPPPPAFLIFDRQMDCVDKAALQTSDTLRSHCIFREVISQPRVLGARRVS